MDLAGFLATPCERCADVGFSELECYAGDCGDCPVCAGSTPMEPPEQRPPPPRPQSWTRLGE